MFPLRMLCLLRKSMKNLAHAFDGSRIPWFAISGDDAVSLLELLELQYSLSHHFLFGFDPPAPISFLIAENYLVHWLENIQFVKWSREAPVAWLLWRLSLIDIAKNDQRFQTLWKDFLTPFLAQHQTWIRLRRWKAIIHRRLLTSCSTRPSRMKVAPTAHRIDRENHDTEQRKKEVPFICWETSFHQIVIDLALGVNVPDLSPRIQVDSVEQPAKSNPVRYGHEYARRTSTFNDVYHGFVIFKDVQLRFIVRRMRSFDSFGFGIERSISFLHARMLGLDIVVGWTYYFNHYVPTITSNQPIHTQSSIQGNDCKFCRTVGDSSLLRVRPTDGNDDNAWSWKWILEISAQSESWNCGRFETRRTATPRWIVAHWAWGRAC